MGIQRLSRGVNLGIGFPKGIIPPPVFPAPPTITITSPGITSGTNYILAADITGLVTTLEYRIDEGAWQALTPTQSLVQAITIQGGPNQVQLRVNQAIVEGIIVYGGVLFWNNDNLLWNQEPIWWG